MDESKLPPDEIKRATSHEAKEFERFFTWLEKSMPRIFFKEVKKEYLPMIVHSLMSLPEQDYFAEIHLKDAAIVICSDSAQADVKILERYPMYGIKNYTTYISRELTPFPDCSDNIRIATLFFTQAIEKEESIIDPELHSQLKSHLHARHPKWSEEACDQLIDSMDTRFLHKMPLEREVIALEMFERAKWRDHCQYEVQYEEDWKQSGAPSMHVVLAWKNVPKHNFLYRLARIVYQHGLVMRRVNAAYIKPYTTESIFMLSFGLHGQRGEAAWEAADIPDFLQEVVTLKYFGSLDPLDVTFLETKLLRGNLVNFLRSMSNFIQQLLVQVDPNLYTLANIHEGLCRHPELTVKLCEAFEMKFHPHHSDLASFERARDEFLILVALLDTGHEYHDRRRKNILIQGMNFITYTLKTNFYRNNKTTHAFRLDPAYLDHAPFDRKQKFPELPYGIFFIKGMHFFGFHIRFRDLSRGGLRTVFPEKKERMLAEWNTIFQECYNLAYTQHKKNKDIPEGGAKCVIFLKPYERLISEADILTREMAFAGMTQEEIEKKRTLFREEQKKEYLYQTQRSFIEGFLTLINCDESGNLLAKQIVDYWKRPEYIYLGPDENMHDPMIEWIAARSKALHYRPGGAFISGKPAIGINHKEYGVTSLGVNVFLDEILRYLGIDPTHEPFTVKMTGGTDGDVAGNQILNLLHHYPKTAKLLALTDVSGTIYDPHGLDLNVLASMFHAGQSIRFYPAERLNEGGFLLDRESRREPSPYVQQTLCWRNRDKEIVADWISGNEMNTLYRHNVHQVDADVFIPCGGRPRTLRDTNYKDFLDETGKPTARAIIEGANLYLTPWARSYLEDLGVLIVKDSSANKGGVICSSFEILSGLILTDSEFLEQKKVLIQEIIERLKKCALDEAKLLLRVHQEEERPLTEISEDISKRINYFTDQLVEHLETVELSNQPKDPLIQCFLHYCPESLRIHSPEQLLKKVPTNHIKAIIASHIAARLVYTRGLNWFPTLVDILPLILQDQELLF